MRLTQFAFAAIISLCSLNAEDIKTLDGTVYKDATIEASNPSGIDISFTDGDGRCVLKGLNFTELPENIQKRYGYNPAGGQQFEAKIKQYGDDAGLDKLTEQEKARVTKTIRELKSKFKGEDVNIDPQDIDYAIFALRRSVTINVKATVKTGSIVEIEDLKSGYPLKNKLILIDGIKLPNDSSWSGFIYPTGVKTNYNNQIVGVFSDSVQRSAKILGKYLNIYGTYAAEEQNSQSAGNENPPDQAGSAGNDPVDSTTYNVYSAPDDGYDNAYGYTYYIGSSYYPVSWYRKHHHRYPPRPRPKPRPPMPKSDRKDDKGSPGQDNRYRYYNQSVKEDNAGQAASRIGNFRRAGSGQETVRR